MSAIISRSSRLVARAARSNARSASCGIRPSNTFVSSLPTGCNTTDSSLLGNAAHCNRQVHEAARFSLMSQISHSSQMAFRRQLYNVAAANSSSLDGEIDNALLTGEECYTRALHALEMSSKIQTEQEEKRAAEQYASMKRAHEREEERATAKAGDSARLSARAKLAEKDGNENDASGGVGGMRSRAAGVAVVKTITKQTRKERDAQVVQQTRGKGASESDMDYKAEAQKWLRTAAFEYNHPKALVRLGNDALKEAKRLLQFSTKDVKPGANDVNNDLPMELRALSPIGRAVQLYEIAGKAGSAEGYFNLGHLLWTGFPEDEAASDAGLHGSADVDTIAALDNIDMIDLQKGEDNILRRDRKSAICSFQKAVQMGDADAMYLLGVQLLSIEDALCDHRRRGLDLIEKAANIGHGGALYYLALFHLNGDGILEVDPCSAQEFGDRLDRAADAGDADALYLRAHCHYNGEDGYEQDNAAALDDFLKSAEAGNADAAISAGAMFYQGGFNGSVQRDRRRAFELYQQAAELGSLEGWRNLVSCYALGEGVPKCDKTARYIADTMLKGQ